MLTFSLKSNQREVLSMERVIKIPFVLIYVGDFVLNPLSYNNSLFPSFQFLWFFLLLQFSSFLTQKKSLEWSNKRGQTIFVCVHTEGCTNCGLDLDRCWALTWSLLSGHKFSFQVTSEHASTISTNSSKRAWLFLCVCWYNYTFFPVQKVQKYKQKIRHKLWFQVSISSTISKQFFARKLFCLYCLAK